MRPTIRRFVPAVAAFERRLLLSTVARPVIAPHDGFPAPEARAGDVRNLGGQPGGDDSEWLDLSTRYGRSDGVPAIRET